MKKSTSPRKPPASPAADANPQPNSCWTPAIEFGLDLPASYLIGDKLSDLQCGWNAGVKKSILVRTGYGKKVESEQAASLGSRHRAG